MKLQIEMKMKFRGFQLFRAAKKLEPRAGALCATALVHFEQNILYKLYKAA